MKPHELVALLVKATEKSTLQVATEMHRASFQGTLHKFISGDVESHARSTAERIAKYFKLPADALYDAQLATRIARERGLVPGHVATKHEVREAGGTYIVQQLHAAKRRFAGSVEARIEAMYLTWRTHAMQCARGFRNRSQFSEPSGQSPVAPGAGRA